MVVLYNTTFGKSIHEYLSQRKHWTFHIRLFTRTKLKYSWSHLIHRQRGNDMITWHYNNIEGSTHRTILVLGHILLSIFYQSTGVVWKEHHEVNKITAREKWKTSHYTIIFYKEGNCDSNHMGKKFLSFLFWKPNARDSLIQKMNT
jgi:hypothetical protein